MFERDKAGIISCVIYEIISYVSLVLPWLLMLDDGSSIYASDSISGAMMIPKA